MRGFMPVARQTVRMARILVTEKIAEPGLDRLRAAGHEVDVREGLSPEQLLDAVRGAHALIIRSATDVTADVLAAGVGMVVVGRAGIGLDNVDVEAATRHGVMVVNGRLMVGNTIGTPLAKTAVPLRAQYWSGQAWEQNGGVEELESVMGSVEFSACRRSLRLSTATGDVCDPVVKVFGAQAATDTVALPMLKGGKANLILAPVGDKSGNVDVFVNGSEYLPSTFGRVSFGQFKSPVIYVREMY